MQKNFFVSRKCEFFMNNFGKLIFVLNNEIMKHNVQQGVSQKVANRIMSLKIITKIGCCGVKFCYEHHLGVFGPA